MESEAELDIAKNEVLRKIGRNMLYFLQMEHMLKFLVTNGKVAGYVSELSTNQEQRAAAINRQTMGPLIGQLLENAQERFKGASVLQADRGAPLGLRRRKASQRRWISHYNLSYGRREGR
jgi:hypothetical protein